MQQELDTQWRRFQEFLQDGHQDDSHSTSDSSSSFSSDDPPVGLGARASAQYSHSNLKDPSSPTSRMTVKQIRRELAQYGVVSDPSCVEKQDLIIKLREARTKHQAMLEQQRQEKGAKVELERRMGIA